MASGWKEIGQRGCSQSVEIERNQKDNGEKKMSAVFKHRGCQMCIVVFFRNYRMKDGIYKSKVAEYEGGGRLQEIIKIY